MCRLSARRLWVCVLWCFVTAAYPLQSVQNPEKDEALVEEGKATLVTQLKTLGISPEDLKAATFDAHFDADALQYMRHRAGDPLAPGPKAALHYFKDNPRAVFDFCCGATLGGSAAYAWSNIFAVNADVSYFLFNDSVTPDVPGYASLFITLFPEVLHNTDVIARIKRQNPLKALCEMPKKTSHKAAVWANRVMCSLFLAKFFKIYYAATWEHEELGYEVSDADYWLAGTYMWTNWWKKYDILNHKIHILLPHKHESLRHKLQGRLAASYRALQRGEDRDLLTFAAFAHQLNKNATTEDEKQQAMLAILSYLYGYGMQRDAANTHITTYSDHPLGPRPKPFSLVAAEKTGRFAGGLLFPAAVLGAYFTWDSVVNILEHNEDFSESDLHYTDEGMHRVDSWFYALSASAYAGYSGWHSGAVWGRNLWCRWMGEDPNQYMEDLHYWPQNLSGIRAIAGGGATYVLSSFLMFPIAGLLTEQISVLGGSMALQKAMLLTTAQWGMLLDTAFMGPRYQELISKVGRTLDADNFGTIKDDALKLIVNLHEGVGRLKTSKLVALGDVLAQLEEKRTGIIGQLAVGADIPLEDMHAQDTTDAMPNTEEMTSKDQLAQPLIANSEYVSGPKPSWRQRLKNWLVGDPVPALLQDLAAQART